MTKSLICPGMTMSSFLIPMKNLNLVSKFGLFVITWGQGINRNAVWGLAFATVLGILSCGFDLFERFEPISEISRPTKYTWVFWDFWSRMTNLSTEHIPRTCKSKIVPTPEMYIFWRKLKVVLCSQRESRFLMKLGHKSSGFRCNVNQPQPILYIF